MNLFPGNIFKIEADPGTREFLFDFNPFSLKSPYRFRRIVVNEDFVIISTKNPCKRHGKIQSCKLAFKVIFRACGNPCSGLVDLPATSENRAADIGVFIFVVRRITIDFKHVCLHLFNKKKSP